MSVTLSISRQSGFSLLELITVLTIISLLIIIGYPLYTQHVLKTHRTQAEVALLDIASGMERYYATHNTYAGADLAAVGVNEYTANGLYQLEIAYSNETDYLLYARPLAAQLSDTQCGILSLNALGVKGISGTGKIKDCW